MTSESDFFKARLRSQMGEKGISRQKLAQDTKRSVSTVARWLRVGLRGGAVPLLEISRAADCSVAYLLGGRDTPERPVYLTEDERIMLEQYRQLRTEERREFIQAILEVREAVKKAKSG